MGEKLIKINNMWKGKVPILSLKRAASFALKKEMGENKKEVSIALVSMDKIEDLNFKYRGKKSVTDVLAFPLSGDVGPAKNLLGEIVICPDVALDYARAKGHSLEDELILLVVHGILHLLGYRDEEEKDRKIMIQKEKEILKLLGKKEQIV